MTACFFMDMLIFLVYYHAYLFMYFIYSGMHYLEWGLLSPFILLRVFYPYDGG